MSVTTKKYTFWWDNSSPDFVFQSQLPPYVDVAIVGAGFAGVSTAYWLLRLLKTSRRKTFRILLLDKAPHPAFKATGRMNGSVYLGSNKSVSSLVDALGDDIVRQLYEYSNKNNRLLFDLIDRGVECDAQFNGGFRMASTAQQLVNLDKSVEWLNKWGFFPAKFDQNKSQYVMISPNTKGSLFIPGEGMLDPFAFTNKLARILRRNNAWISYGTDVVKISNDANDDLTLLLSNGHVLAAGKIVCTTSTIDGGLDYIDSCIIRRREHVIRTHSLSADLDDMPIPRMPVEFDDGLDSARIYGRSVIMTGGKAELEIDPELGILNDSGYNDKILAQLDKSMLRNFPITNHTEISHTWTYIETETSDGLPLMGEIPGRKGHYVNIGHGRNKFGLAFLGARNIAERILRIKMSCPEFKIFDPKRLARGE